MMPLLLIAFGIYLLDVFLNQTFMDADKRIHDDEEPLISCS